MRTRFRGRELRVRCRESALPLLCLPEEEGTLDAERGDENPQSLMMLFPLPLLYSYISIFWAHMKPDLEDKITKNKNKKVYLNNSLAFSRIISI